MQGKAVTHPEALIAILEAIISVNLGESFHFSGSSFLIYKRKRSGDIFFKRSSQSKMEYFTFFRLAIKRI